MSQKPVIASQRTLRQHIMSSLESTLLRCRDTASALLQGGMVAGAIAVAATGTMTGCGLEENPGALGTIEQELIGQGQADWAQQQGQRNASMVNYYGENWTATGGTCGRACTIITYYFKLAVRPVAGANLSQKRVGLVYRRPYSTTLTTVDGRYFTTWADGREEWHVAVSFNGTPPGVLSFNAFYQDGAGSLYYDDNNGELHAYAQNSYNVVSRDSYETNVGITAQGVQGKIAVRVADIDPDKVVGIVWTTNGWQTANYMDAQGAGPNQWRWVADYNADYERWEVNVNILGTFTRFEYAIYFRHGVVNGARPYQYWDNNSNLNYVVVRP